MHKYAKQLLKASYMNQDDAEKYMNHYGFKYDPELSRNDTKVFVDPNGKPVIAHRGTRRLTDWADDALLMFGIGEKTHRYKNAERVTKRAEEKYGQTADALGHSLGGWLTEQTGHGNKLTYNKAVGLGDLFKDVSKNQTDYRTPRDVVSLGSLTQKTNTHTVPDNHLLQTIFTAHDMKNFHPELLNE